MMALSLGYGLSLRWLFSSFMTEEDVALLRSSIGRLPSIALGKGFVSH